MSDDAVTRLMVGFVLFVTGMWVIDEERMFAAPLWRLIGFLGLSGGLLLMVLSEWMTHG